MKLISPILAVSLFLLSTTATSLQLEERTPYNVLEQAQLQLAKKQMELASNLKAAEEALAIAEAEVAHSATPESILRVEAARLKLEKALAEHVIGADTEFAAVESANEARALHKQASVFNFAGL